jgi:hypothetical protein
MYCGSEKKKRQFRQLWKIRDSPLFSSAEPGDQRLRESRRPYGAKASRIASRKTAPDTHMQISALDKLKITQCAPHAQRTIIPQFVTKRTRIRE